ncbi:preprotein translocase subunit YajC [Actinophytocola sp.]|jgi:preprotein translocase subunit YajC|uniref:preprotein translocase subunit YajC n=1 Tax=Actinophytocola sp. TaxID=1872138 RepID=UPI002D63B257|nr:preprotein translocase subunit YajC [Actinophytocola sp.]HYQ62081.1 preprotein translocase subunit YajC [Actinophytocola sp.]
MQQLLPMLLLFGLLGVMMYFMTRRQRRAQEQQATLQNSLEVGDRVMTTSGLYGTITDADDGTTVTLEIAPGVETEWLRAAVREKVGPVEEHDEDLDADDLEVPETPETIDVETNEPPVIKEDAELESGKKK